MTEPIGEAPGADPLALLAGGGEMGERTRAFDWSKTPVGPISGWPQSLKIVVRTMLDSRYAMWLGWGPGFTFFYNDAYARMTLGPKHPWALGRPASEVWSEIWADIGPRAESVLRTGQATWDEGLLLFLERQGFREETYHTFSYSPVPNDEGGVGGMLCVVTEDTGRSIGERRLRTLRELGARTTENAQSVEEACRTAAAVLAENPQDLSFVLLYLLSEDERHARLAARTGLEATSPACPGEVDLGQSPWPFREAAQNREPIVVEDLAQRFGDLTVGAWPEPTRRAVILPMTRGGQNRPAGFVAAGISPRLTFDDRYKGFLELIAGHIATAIDNARAYEHERRRSEALAELDRAKTAFFSNVSHEFRTPLTLMLGAVEEMLAGGRGEPQEQLDVVHRNGLRLLRLVNTLLDFSRIEAGRVRASFQPTELATFTCELASMFRSAIERAGLTLVLDCEALPEPVYIDREMWEKILLNLLSNALKFTFDGQIVVMLRRAGDFAELSVRDTGTGVPADELPRLFERFHRVENARGRTHEGTGIGLALVQELVRMHGGSIDAHSTLGDGTSFTIRLPLGRAHLPADQVGSPLDSEVQYAGPEAFVEEALRWLPDPADAVPGPRAAGLRESRPGSASPLVSEKAPRVLVADDNADMRQYVARVLAERYRVETAADGQAAFAAALDDPPDLIVSDIMMPRVDGVELLRRVRSEPTLAQVPVVFLSARAGEESLIAGMETGADDYLVKPFSAKELLARVAAHLKLAQVRREGDEALRRSEERFRAVVEATPECVKIVAADGTLLYMNPAGLGMVEADSLSEIAGGRVLDLIAPEGQASWQRFHERICQGERVDWEFDIIGRQGTRRTMETHGVPLRMPDGSMAQLAVTRDVTERRRFEELEKQRGAALAETNAQLERELQRRSIGELAQARLAAIVESSDDAIISKNLDGTIVSWNRAAERLFGYRPEEAIGRNILLIVPAERHDEEQMILARLRKGEKIDHFETKRQRKDGEQIDISLSVSPIHDFSGRVVGASKIARDITAWKRLEEEREALLEAERKARGNAQRINALKDEFLATLSHELRTPLSAIMGWAQLLSTGRMQPDEFVEAGRVIERNARTQKQLIDDLLDMSRIVSGKLRLDLQRIAPIGFIEAAIETVLPTAEAKGIRIEKMLDPTAGPIAGDPARLQQVAWNLLSNAVKFTPKGGRIQILLERVNSHLELTVADNGEGIDPDFLPHLFERFRQADATTTRRHGGLGLGLSIVKQIIELHGGSVLARSAGPGTGSTFVLHLPVLILHAPEETGDERLHPRSSLGLIEPLGVDLSNLRVLVVDDEPDARELVRRLLAESGATVRAVESGRVALTVLASEPQDVLISDIGMPEMDGYELLRHVRRLPSGSGIPAVALTAFARTEDRTRAMRAGYIAHVAKPVEPAELLATIAVVTGRPTTG